MLKGKNYNNGIRVHLYIAEAITRMKYEAFENWLVTKNKYGIYNELKDMDEIHAFQKDHNTENFEQCVNIFQPILELFEEFEHLLSDTEEYHMAAYWTSYLDMVQTLRDFSKSIKIGDWDLHMYASEKMLHWFHAYDNYNYARHFPYYWATRQHSKKNLKTVAFLFNRLLVNSTKCLQTKLLNRQSIKIKRAQVYTFKL